MTMLSIESNLGQFVGNCIKSRRVQVSVAIGALIALGGCFLRREPPIYPEPDRLVSVLKITPPNTDEPISGAEFLEWRAQSRELNQFAAYLSRGVSLTDAIPERISCGVVSAEFFPLLGVPPSVGRTFLPEEHRPGSNQVVVISHDLWLRRYGGNPSLIGTTVKLDQAPYTIIGIMPAGLQLPDDCDLWIPLALDDEMLRLKDQSFGLRVMARLRQGIKIDQAQAEMSTIANRIEEKSQASQQGRLIKLVAPAEVSVKFQRREQVQGRSTPLQITIDPK
jgi:putative ABC transport system permease protein